MLLYPACSEMGDIGNVAFHPSMFALIWHIKLEPNSQMKCLTIIFEKNKTKNVINLSSTDFA